MLSVRFSNDFVRIHPPRRPGLRLRDGLSSYMTGTVAEVIGGRYK
jgi:hypothetical protein